MHFGVGGGEFVWVDLKWMIESGSVDEVFEAL